jgi:hypothetical protein
VSDIMMKKLAYIFLLSVILFAVFQYNKYQDTFSLIFNNADIKDVKRQAMFDTTD